MKLILTALALAILTGCAPHLERVEVQDYLSEAPACPESFVYGGGERMLVWGDALGRVALSISPSYETMIAHELCSDTRVRDALERDGARLTIHNVQSDFDRQWSGFDMTLTYSGQLKSNSEISPFKVETKSRVSGALLEKNLQPAITDSVSQVAAELKKIILEHD